MFLVLGILMIKRLDSKIIWKKTLIASILKGMK